MRIFFNDSQYHRMIQIFFATKEKMSNKRQRNLQKVLIILISRSEEWKPAKQN